MVPGREQKPNESLVPLLHLILFKNTRDHIRNAEADTFIFLLNSIPPSFSKERFMFKKYSDWHYKLYLCFNVSQSMYPALFLLPVQMLKCYTLPNPNGFSKSNFLATVFHFSVDFMLDSHQNI